LRGSNAVGTGSRDSQDVPVSAVVVARNREGVILRCLAALRDAGPDEIIVVDGRSSDDTLGVARRFGATVLSDDGAGLAAARNLGARAAHSDWIAFVDSDSVVEPGTLRLLVDEARELRLDAVQAKLLPISGRLSYWQRGEAWRRRNRETPGLARGLGCQATLIRRDILVSPGFDPVFTGAGEDGDFFARACAHGARIAFSDRAVAYHEDRRSLSDFVRQRIWHGRGLARSAFRDARHYRSAIAQDGSSAGSGAIQSPRFLLFLAVSMWALAVGFALELARLTVDPELRRKLKGGTNGEGGFGVLARRPPDRDGSVS
jgi:glycosyltransferase involved in cell wall biosynthesis